MKSRKSILVKIVLYLILVMISCVALFPILYVVFASFRSNQEIFEFALPFTWKTIIPQNWTMDNYKAIFQEFKFGYALRNTIIVVAITVPISLFISALGGYAFAFFQFKGKKLLFGLCLVSFMVPIDAIALPLYNEISKLGLVNTYWSLILPSAASGLAMFLFTQFFKEIPKDFLEAARIDGASWLQILLRIVLPLSIPVVITAGLMVFVNEWNNFFWPLLATRTEDVRTIQVALSYFSDENEVYFSYIYAASTISMIVPIFLFLPLQKYFVQGIASSGVKG
jgi:ABC-type glycerol-3-phosphate transport system permease component